MKLFRHAFLHLAAGAAALPAVSRIAQAQAYPTQLATLQFTSIKLCTSLLVLGAAMASSPPAGAADYYAGKTIDIVVGGNPGTSMDVYARTVARHMPRHIPGNPVIVVKNMPGAGSTRAGIYINTVAPRDGTSIGALQPGSIMGALLDDKPNTQFDPTKVIYLGTADSGVRLCMTFQHSKIRTFEDAQRQKTIVGASTAGGSTRDYAYLHNKTAGTKFDMATGYRGSVDIMLAMERGEVDGMCGYAWSGVKSQKPDWLRDKKINVLVQVGLEPDAELTRLGVPSVWNYVKAEHRTVAELVISQQLFQRPYIAPPGTPAEQIGILRTAFDATLRDPQLLADAEKMGIDISPLSGTKVQEIVQKLHATPKDIVERARAAIRP